MTSLSILSTLAFPGPAQALALLSMSPGVGSTLSKAPTQVVLTFDTPLGDQGSIITVSDSFGNRVDDGSVEISGKRALVGIHGRTAAGTFTVSYQVIAADGTSLSSSAKFTLATSTTPSPTPTDPLISDSMSPEPTTTFSPLEPTAKKSFVTELKRGGIGLLLGVLLLTVLLSRLARRKRR